MTNNLECVINILCIVGLAFIWGDKSVSDQIEVHASGGQIGAAGTNPPDSETGDGKPRKTRKLSEARKKKRNQRTHARRRENVRRERAKLREELAAMGLEWFPIFRKFPDEFQRAVFELAYHQERDCRLILVSSKVKEWCVHLEPFYS